ncbi:hypothetical protein Vretimale_4904, partial [Volvox reticuliferus]
QDAAAATAFRFLSEQPLYGSLKPYEESLLRTLATRVLSPQGLYRDPEMHGAAAAAAAYLDGYLPLAAMPHSRILRGWAKEYGKSYDADLAVDPVALIDAIRRELTAQAATRVTPEAAAAAEVEGAVSAALKMSQQQDPAAVAARAAAEGAAAALGLGLGPSGLCVRLPPESLEAAPPGAIHQEVDPSVESAGGMATLVVIPADTSLALREESIPARGCLLSRVAELLACPSPHHVMQWGRVGHKVSVMADPRVVAAVARATTTLATTATAEQPAAAKERDLAGAGPSASEGTTNMAPSVAGSIGRPGGGGCADEDNVQPAESESEAASAPAPTAEPHFAQPPPPQARPRRPATSASAAGVCTSATSDQSICLPPPAGLGGMEETGAVMLHVRQLSGFAAAPAGASAGSGGVEVIGPVAFMQPPSSSAPYRVDSTLTLAVQRGPAAMDWEADGQNEVRGPEHTSAPSAGPATGGGGGGGGRHRGGSRAGRDTHTHDSRLGGKLHHGGAPSTTAVPPGAGGNRPGGAGAGGSGGGMAEASGLPTLSTKLCGGGTGNNAAGSPRHANIHPFLSTVPEPSLYSKLLLPPLSPQPHGRRGVDAATAADLPLLGSLRNAAATASRAAGTSSGSVSGSSISALPYSLAGEQLNVRATWLAGKPVYGDAIATTCRQSPTPQIRKNHHVMKWRNYGPKDEWRTANAMAPAAAYVRAVHAPLLLRGLPGEFRGAASWVGPLPRQLLDSYVAAHSPAAAITSLELVVPDVDLPGEGVAELAGTNFLGLPYKVIAGPGPLEVVSQQAALCALLKLQSLDAACLAGTVTPEQLTGRQPQADESQQPQQQAETTTGPAATPVEAAAARMAAVAVAEAAVAGEAGEEAAKAMSAAAPGPGSVDVAVAPMDVNVEVEVLVEVEVVDPGLAHARRPQEGSMVKIAYTISLPPETVTEAETGPLTDAGPRGGGEEEAGSGGPVVLEQHPMLSLVVGAAGTPAVPPIVDQAVRQLRVGGIARCRLPTPLEGCDVVGGGFAAVDTDVELKLLHASLPVVDGRVAGVGGASAGPPLFTPPLGQQRMEAVAALLRRENVATLVDLGCGECRLMEGLLLGRHGADCGGPLRRMVGLDISQKALASGAKRLGKMVAAATEMKHLPLRGEESVPQPVEVVLYRGSAMSPAIAREVGKPGVATRDTAGGTDPWVGLRGCDAVAMVEVVEHLDPVPLQLVGPCVLGGLRPRLLLVTTPNWEYNAIMRSCEQLAVAAAAAARNNNNNNNNSSKGGSPRFLGGHWPGPPDREGLPMRCGDHRFEWSREEFRSWAQGLAATWGYEVTFEGVGRANDEQAALGALGCGDKGEATQMAVFRRMQEEELELAVTGAEQKEVEVGQGEGWELVWGPALVAASREEYEEAEAEIEAEEARRQTADATEGGRRLQMRTSSTAGGAAGGAAGAGVKRSSRAMEAAASEAAGGGVTGDGGGVPEAPVQGDMGAAPPAKRRAAGGRADLAPATAGELGADPPEPLPPFIDDPSRVAPDPHPDPPEVDVF